jgi:hypothetical protein
VDVDNVIVILLVLPTIHRLQPARQSESRRGIRRAAKVRQLHPHQGLCLYY